MPMGHLACWEGAPHAAHGRRPGSTVSGRTPAQEGATHALHGWAVRHTQDRR
jgi:hypothetical protein